MAWTTSQESAFKGKITGDFSQYNSIGTATDLFGNIILEWQVIHQSGMDSTIKYALRFVDKYNRPNDYYFLISTNSYLKINGEPVFVGADIDRDTKFSVNGTLTHGNYTLTRSSANNTGTFKVEFFVSCSRYLTGASDPQRFCRSDENISYTWSIPSTTTAGYGAQITAVSNFDDETAPVISYYYDKGTNVDSAKIEVGIAFSGSNIRLPYREIPINENSYVFNFTEDDLNTLYTLLQDGETATLRFFLRTTETIGEENIPIISEPFTKAFTFVNYKPLLTPTIRDTNSATIAVTGNDTHIVKYLSKVAYNMNVELRKGALDIIGCYIQNGGRIEEGFTEGTFENPTSNIFYFSATDDRGHTGTASKSLSLFDGEFIDYVKLTASVKSTPISGEGNMTFTITGKYFNANFGAAQNQLVVQYAVYKKGTTPNWSEATAYAPDMLDNTTYEVSFAVDGLDYTAQYVVAVKVNDLLMSTEASVSVVAKPVFYWNADNFIFNVPVTFNEGLSGAYEDGTASGYYMNSSGQYSSGGYSWTYRKWTDGTLECWCSVPISTTVNTAWGNMYVAAVSNIYKTDLSYPVQLVGTPVVIVTLGAGGTKGMLIADNSYAADNISTGRYNIASPVSITSNATFRLNYYVRGKWK